MRKPDIRKITIDPRVGDTEIASKYRQYGKEAGIEVEECATSGDKIHDGETLASGKKQVYVTRFQGEAVKQCTGLEEHYVCCNLHVMNQTTNCPLDCSYCILQAYINRPVTTVHANTDEMVAQLVAQAEAQPGRLFRVGTGDLGDALALDPLGQVTGEMIPSITRLPNVVLELKTKSNTVDNLLSLDHGGRVVVAWSLNTHQVISQEEHRCATLEERLVAAEKVVKAGYLVAFHFDPMIYHSGWESGYDDVVSQVFNRIDPARIAWISMGSLRYPPSMQREMERRFPNTGLTLGEMLIGSDGKKRYVKPIRMALYKRLLAAVRAAGGEDVFVYLCMESQEVWRRVMNHVPESNNALDYAFSVNLVKKYPYLLPMPPQWSDYRQAVNMGMDTARTA